MASLSHLTDLDLEQQVATLSKELAALKKSLSRRGGGYFDDSRDAAWDFYSDIAERVSDGLPYMRKRARALEDTARDHPATTAAIGLVVVGLLAALVFSRR
jgi:hypothetical protein